jgi:hypothetical protein
LRVTDTLFSTDGFHFIPPRMIGWALQRAHLFLLRHSVQPLALPSAIHLRTATMPALTVTLSASALGSAMGDSVEVGWVFGFDGVGLVII